MRTPGSKNLAFAAAMLLLLAALWLARRETGPLYQGRPAKAIVVGILSTNLVLAVPLLSGMEPELAVPGLIEVLERNHGWRARTYRKVFAIAPRALQRRLPQPRDYQGAAFVAMMLLGDYGPEAKAAIPALIEELGRTNRFNPTRPIQALDKIDRDDPRVVRALMRYLQSNAPEYSRAEAALVLSRAIPPPAQLKEEAWKLAATQGGARVSSVLKTLNERDPSHLSFCLAQLHNSNPLVRRVSVAALGATRPVRSETVTALLAATDDLEPTVAEAALGPLTSLVEGGGAPDELRLRCVRRVLERGDGPQKWAALGVLDSLGPAARGAMGDVAELLDHKDPRLRSRAASSLGRMGEVDTATLAALLEARHDTWEFVRDAVERALVMLCEPGTATP